MPTPTTTMCRTVLLVLAVVSLGSCAEKTSTEAVGHCDAFFGDVRNEFKTSLPTDLDLRFDSLRSSHKSLLFQVKHAPEDFEDAMRHYRRRFERVMGPLFTDSRVAQSGLLPSSPPSTLTEATEQWAELERALPRLRDDIEQQWSQCVAAMTEDPVQGRCMTRKRLFDAFSKLCSRLSDHLSRHGTIEDEHEHKWTAMMMEDLGSRLHTRAWFAAASIEGRLDRFMDEVDFPVWTKDTTGEWSSRFRAALHHRRLVVRIAASLAPAECGPITVDCPL